MTAEEFWEDDPNLFVAYRTSFINKEKRKAENDNYVSWLNGLYIYNANTIINNNLVVSIEKMFFKKGNYSSEKYPNKPYDFKNGKNNKELNDKNINSDKKYYNKFNFFATMKKEFKNRIKKGE